MRPQPPRFAPLTSPVGEHCDYPGFCVLRACARSLCKAEVKLGTRATPNLKFCRSNSLIPSKNSLFFEIFSLIIRLGNCARNRCSTAVSCIKLGSEGARIAKFPVKFPVSWESGWRRVRSALRRQPGSRSTEDCWTTNSRSARQLRPFVDLLSVSTLPICTILERNRG